MTASPISLQQTDITRLEVDAIVNAANNSLLGGGGVDGAIHRAAGPQLLDACRPLNGCATGAAKITPGFRLPARYVIHTVGPVWQGGTQHEAELLADCYRNSLQLASEHQLSSIAFPAISCGVYGYPIEQAAAIAVQTIDAYLQQHNDIEQVILVAFNEDIFNALQQALDALPK
jgi:O-acetyl-ADP-ribose deacetylase (regulator of RNase III)